MNLLFSTGMTIVFLDVDTLLASALAFRALMFLATAPMPAAAMAEATIALT